MSGVGKTYQSVNLGKQGWYHYSTDYRIGSAYMKKAIEESVLKDIVLTPALQPLFDNQNIRVCSALTIEDLSPLSNFIGKLGNPELGGINFPEFLRRQQLHYHSEVQATLDAKQFAEHAKQQNYTGFINDASGSLCEIVDSGIFEKMQQYTLILHIKSSQEDKTELIERAQAYPKPMYFNKEFLEEQIQIFMHERNHEYVALIDPYAFAQWILPKLVYHRAELYQSLADNYGYTVTSQSMKAVRTQHDFINLIAQTIEQSPCL